MKTRRDSGFSMVMVLVALGLISVTAFTSLGYVAYQKQQMRRIFIQSWSDDFRLRVEEVLASPTTCTQLLPNQNLTIAAGSEIPLQAINVNRLLNDRILSIKDARISDIVSAVSPGNPTLPNTFTGLLHLTLEYKDAGMNADQAFNGLLGDAVFNVKIYGDHNSQSVTNLKCSSQGNESALYISQICSLYGGLLTDGVHCDFPKINSNSLSSNSTLMKTENGAMPYVNMATANSNFANRVSMPQMLCYLDTLIALSPSLPIAVATASAKIRNYTKYCARPGGSNIGRTSLDIRFLFQNLQ